MAPAAHHPRPRLTASRLALLQDLTRALTEAVRRGDLERAEWLLRQRQAALTRLDLSEPLDEALRQDLEELEEMERQLLEFCRTWREIVRERLAGLAASQRLHRAYGAAAAAVPEEPEPE